MIALVTVAHNEAHRMREHLDLAAVYCDELVVVVQDSDDGTADVVDDFGATLLRDECHGMSEPSRDLAMSHVTAPWVMYLDADEHLDPAHIADLPDIQDRYFGARLSVGAWTDGVRTDMVMPDGRYHANRQLRFFRRDMVKWGSTNHSRFEPTYWATEDNTFHQSGEPWVFNIKSAVEAAVDAARYERLGR